MPLTFPTQAEQAIARFKALTKTISMATIALEMKAGKEKLYDNGRVILWHFDDDTTVEIRGAGKSWRAKALLP